MPKSKGHRKLAWRPSPWAGVALLFIVFGCIDSYWFPLTYAVDLACTMDVGVLDGPPGVVSHRQVLLRPVGVRYTALVREHAGLGGGSHDGTGRSCITHHPITDNTLCA